MGLDEVAWQERQRRRVIAARRVARQDAPRTLGLWADFPATAEPRPIVLIHGPIRVEGGFASGLAKRGLQGGRTEADGAVPDEPLRRIHDEGNGRTRPGETLRVRSAVLDRSWFLTDRGPIELAAWRVDAVDARGPIWVLADEVVRRCWLHPEPRAGSHDVMDAALASDGRTLTLGVIGGKPALFHYEVIAVESASAVLVAPVEHQFHAISGFMTLEGYRHEVTVELAAPLAGRVLIRGNATPIQIVLA